MMMMMMTGGGGRENVVSVVPGWHHRGTPLPLQKEKKNREAWGLLKTRVMGSRSSAGSVKNKAGKVPYCGRRRVVVSCFRDTTGASGGREGEGGEEDGRQKPVPVVAKRGGVASSEGETGGRILWPSLHPDDANIFSLAVPAVLALAADPLLQVVDTAFVGHAGPDALAALGINSALFTFSFLVFNFLGTATTPLIARARVADDARKAGLVALQALTVAGLCGSTLAVLLWTCSDQALMVMGADSNANPITYTLAAQFLYIRAFAAPAVMLTTVGQGVFGGLQDMKTPLGITLAANVINLTLDFVLILGLGWGIRGAATATVCAEWTAASIYLVSLWRRRDLLGGSEAPKEMARLMNESFQELLLSFKPFFNAGGAVFMRTILLLGTKTLASATATRLGSTEIASHQVVMQLWLLTSMAVDSLAVSGQSLVAVELGKAKSDSMGSMDTEGLDTSGARRVSNRLLQLGVGSGILLAIVFGTTYPFIPSLFTDDADVKSVILHILPIAIAMLPINGAVYVLDGILVGARDFKWMAMAMTVAAGSAILLLASVEPLDLGIEGVWYALAALMTFRLGTLVYRYQSDDGPLSPARVELIGEEESLKRSSNSENTNGCSGDTGTTPHSMAPVHYGKSNTDFSFQPENDAERE